MLTKQIPKNLVKRVREYFGQVQMHLGFRYLLLGAAVGCISGLLGLAVRVSVFWLSELFYGDLVKHGRWSDTDTNYLFIFSLPPICGALVAWLTARFSVEARGHGVPEVMNAVATARGFIPAKVIWVKFIGSVLSIASGFSVGRIGPTILIGSTVGSLVGRLLHMSMMRVRMLIGCGAAAGIAATFNSPIAGSLFALEIILRDFNISYLTPVILSAMVGTILSRELLGDFHDLLPISSFAVADPREYFLYAILGCSLGLIGLAFTKLHARLDAYFLKKNFPAWLLGATGGIGISFVLLLMPLASGPANWSALQNEMYTTELNWTICLGLLVLAVVKMFATSWSIATGASGGVFAPSLLIGGSLGIVFGFVAQQLFPDTVLVPLGYSLVGMGAFFAAIIEAPLTAIMIVFELSADYNTVIPLTIASVCAIGVYSHYQYGNIYTFKLLNRGIDLQGGHEVGIMKTILVRDIYRSEDSFFYETDNLEKLLAYFKTANRSTVPVVDRDKKLVAVVGVWDLKTHSEDEGFPDQLKVSDIEVKNVKFVTPDDSLHTAIERISEGDFEYLPVVRNADDLTLVGRISRQLVFQAYKNALTIRGMAQVMAGRAPISALPQSFKQRLDK